MDIHSVGKRGTVFEFDDPYRTNVYVINGDKHVFVCDTFCGSDSMEIIKEHLKKIEADRKPIVIFNSHSHYDHVWGNGSLDAIMVIAHIECRRLLESEGRDALDKYDEHRRGEVVSRMPDVVFEKRVTFAEEGVELFHTPGHTVDSASCMDTHDKILFVGDNIETPIPYLNEPDLAPYISTLESYLDLEWKYVVPGHDLVQTDDALIRENIEYLRGVESWCLDLSDLETGIAGRHIMNLAAIAEKLENGLVTEIVTEHYRQAAAFLESRERTPTANQILAKLAVIADRS